MSQIHRFVVVIIKPTVFGLSVALIRIVTGRPTNYVERAMHKALVDICSNLLLGANNAQKFKEGTTA